MASIGKTLRQDERISSGPRANNVVSIRVGDSAVPLRVSPSRLPSRRDRKNSARRHLVIEVSFLVAAIGTAALIWLSGF